MKTLFKSIALITSFAIASVAMAASINQSYTNGQSQADLSVTDVNGSTVRSSSVNVDEGDKISFMLAYNLNEGPSASNLRAYIENLDGRTFAAGSTETVTGRITSSNYDNSNGSVTLRFNDNVKLNFYNVSWQKQECMSPGCESSLLGSPRSVISSTGLSLGNVSNTDSDYKGGLVIEFKAFADTPAPTTYDDCSVNGVTVAHGASRTFFSATQTSGTCSAIDQTRSCNDGTLSGSNTYRYTSCSVNNNSSNDDVTTNSASKIDDDSARLNGSWEGDDNIDVWFAFSRTDSTPSCNVSSQTVGQTNVDDNDSFAETVSNLRDNTKYYFRACAEKSNGSIDSGVIRNFTTDEEDDNNNDSDDVDVTTNSPSSIDEDSARLNGRMRGDDNIDAWFAFSRTDSTPSCNVSSQRVGKTNVDDNDSFAETVTNLVSNTKYYYRACAEDNDGSIESGSIRSFVTDEDEDDNNTPVRASTVTNVASVIGTNSARFNAIVLGEDDATCYFQYGRTTSLGLTSALTRVDLDRQNTCSSFRSGLASNSTYYYRSVLVQDGKVNYGAIRSFRTDRTTTTVVTPRPPVTPVTPNNPTVTDTDTTITIINQNVEREEAGNGNGLELTKWVSAGDDTRFSEETSVQPGEAVYYKVRVTNETGSDLEDVVVTDRIPSYLELSNDRDLDDEDDKRITWVVDLEDGQSRTFITEMRLREDTRGGDVIDSFATAEADEFEVDSNEVVIEVEDQRQFNASQAGFAFGAGFFPDTMFGWLLLILIVLAIAFFISRILVSRNENARVLAELAAAKAAQNKG